MTVNLGIEAVEFQPGNETFGERTARAFREHGDFRAQLVAGREVVFRLAVFVDAFVFGQDAGDSIFFVEQFPSGKLREDIDAFFLDKSAEPLHEFVERNHVVPVIAQRRRSDGKLARIAFGEVVGGVAGDRRIERRGFLEIRNEFAERARIHDRAGELMRADLPRFFEDIDIFGGKRGGFFLRGVALDQVRKMERAGKPGGPGADDQNVRFKLFALNSHDRNPGMGNKAARFCDG